MTRVLNRPRRVCGDIGPRRPGTRVGYACTRTAAHPGVHEAWLDGQLLDSWPQRPHQPHT